MAMRHRCVRPSLNWVAKSRTRAMRLRIRRCMYHRTSLCTRGKSECLLRLAIGRGQACRAPILPHRAAMKNDSTLGREIARLLAQHKRAASF